MKEVTKTLLLFGGFILVAIAFAFIAIYYIVEYDMDCLEEYAKSYCKEKGFPEYAVYDGSYNFECVKELDERKGRNGEYFYYTEEERNACISKESGTWK